MMDQVNKYAVLALMLIIIYLLVIQGDKTKAIINALAEGTVGIFGNLQGRTVTYGATKSGAFVP